MHARSARLLTLAVLAAALVPAAARAAAPGIATIGLVRSASGPSAALSATQANGAHLAVDELNAANRLGFHLVLAERDDGSTASGAQGAFTDLLGQGVAALLGPTLSANALAADPIAQQAPLPVVAISNTADGITEIGDYVFRASLLERQQVTAAARLSVKRLGFKRPVMIVRSDQPFAVGGGAAFRTALKAAGAPLVGEVAYEGAGSEEGFAALLAALAAKRPDALIVESLTEGPQIMRQARAAAAFRRVPLLGGNAFNSSSVIKAAGAAAEGLIVGAAWHPDVPGKESRAFVKAYRKRFKATPDQFAATAYTAVLAVADAVRRAQSAEPAAVRDALATTTKLPSPLGPFSFGAGRGVKAAGIVQIVRKGKFTLLR